MTTTRELVERNMPRIRQSIKDAEADLTAGRLTDLDALMTSLQATDESSTNDPMPAGTQDDRIGQRNSGTHGQCADPVTTSLRTMHAPLPMDRTPAGITLPADHTATDAQCGDVGGNHSSPPATDATTPRYSPLEGNPTGNGSAATIAMPTTKGQMSLADPFLALAADVLDDTEQTKIANENRLRQLTRTAVDADGEERGFGLDESHPDVANLAALVALLGQVEHQAVLQLQRKMRKHPLGPWIKSQKGVGDKQAARLLAVIGDPYWNDLHNRPRTVSELWAYCGLHVLPASHWEPDTQKKRAGGADPAGGDSGQCWSETHPAAAGVAARRQKGVKGNWSTIAKSRAYLISESMLRKGDRSVYDRRKAATEGRLHSSPCVRCGPKGKPALPGSPWSDGHRHADALRIQSKELLKGLWREAKRLHEEH